MSLLGRKTGLDFSKPRITMEDRHIIIDDTLAEHGIVLSTGAQKDLRTAGMWGILLSIFGFIYALIIVFSGITMLTIFQTMPSIPASQQGTLSGMGVFMIIAGLAFIVPTFFLLRFSMNALKANSSMKTYTLTETMSHLKLSFMTFGLMILFSMFLYFIGIIYIASLGGF